MTGQNSSNPHVFMINLCSRLALAFTITAFSLLPAENTWAQDHADTDQAPGTARLLDEDGFARFPFDIHGGDIRFQAQINGHPVHLLLDDGNMWDQLLFWGGPEVDALELEPDGEILIGDTNDETAIPSTIANEITLELPGVEFTNQTAIITPASSGTNVMWAGSVGQVSAAFFKHFVVEIDFDTMMITLFDPETFEYRGDGEAVPWLALPWGGRSIPGTLRLEDGRRVTLKLFMDLGYNDQLHVQTGGDHDLEPPTGAEPASLGFNIQRQETRGFIGPVPGVEIGGFEVQNVPAGFIAEEHDGRVFHEVMIGLGLLARFNLTFDYSRQRLIVEPNSHFSKPFGSAASPE